MSRLQCGPQWTETVAVGSVKVLGSTCGGDAAACDDIVPALGPIPSRRLAAAFLGYEEVRPLTCRSWRIRSRTGHHCAWRSPASLTPGADMSHTLAPAQARRPKGRCAASCFLFGSDADTAGRFGPSVAVRRAVPTAAVSERSTQAASAGAVSSAQARASAADKGAIGLLSVSAVTALAAAVGLEAQRRRAGVEAEIEAASLEAWRRRAEVEAQPLQDPRDGGNVTSLLQIWGMTSPSLMFGFMASNFVILVLPLEARALLPLRPSAFVGAASLIIGGSMLFGPIAGRISDSLKHPLGRRRPSVIMSLSLLELSTAGMWLCGSYGFQWSYLALLFTQQVFVHAASASAAALLTDIVDPNLSATASGVHTANALAGGILGFVTFHALASVGADYRWNYFLLAAMTDVTLPIFCFAADEVDTRLLALPPPMDWSQPSAIREIFYVNWQASPNFALVVQERSIYYCGTAYKAYLLYAARDLLGLQGLQNQTMVIAQVALLAESVAVAAALVSSLLVDRQVVRPQQTSAIGAVILAFAGQFWTVALLRSPSRRVAALCIEAAIYGVGQGMYLAGDFALTLKTVPDRREANRYLSLAHSLSACVGGSLGGVYTAATMEFLGRRLPKARGLKLVPGAYHFDGYAAAMLTSMLLNLWVANVALRVQTPEELTNPQDGPQEAANPQGQ